MGTTLFSPQTGKTRAFLIHLAISALVVGLAIALIFVFWYPPPYFQVIGTWMVLRILVGVDLVLGPLLTLIVFRAGKPRLLLDMTVIAVIQLAALVYGLTIIYQERPYAAVFVVDRFEIMTRGELDLTAAAPALQQKPNRGPIMAVALVPTNPEDRLSLLEEVLAGKPDIQFRPQYWIPYQEGIQVVLAKAKTVSALLPPPNPSDQARAERLVQRYGGHADSVVYVPVMGKAGPATLLLDSESAQPVDAAAINPWPAAPGPNPLPGAG